MTNAVFKFSEQYCIVAEYYRICSGYECCPDGRFVCGDGPYVRCYDARAAEADCSCLVTSVLSAGVVMSGYKEQCHANYVWVDWRQKCLRRN